MSDVAEAANLVISFIPIGRNIQTEFWAVIESMWSLKYAIG